MANNTSVIFAYLYNIRLKTLSGIFITCKSLSNSVVIRAGMLYPFHRFKEAERVTQVCMTNNDPLYCWLCMCQTVFKCFLHINSFSPHTLLSKVETIYSIILPSRKQTQRSYDWLSHTQLGYGGAQNHQCLHSEPPGYTPFVLESRSPSCYLF